MYRIPNFMDFNGLHTTCKPYVGLHISMVYILDLGISNPLFKKPLFSEQESLRKNKNKNKKPC